MSIAVIINPIAGGARAETARQRSELAAAIIEGHGEEADVLVTERRGHARLLAAAALKRGARLIMVWGGDGTVNEVASALAFGDVPLAIIAAGSGNGLATELGVDLHPERAIAAAIRALPRQIDLGELDGHLFVNLAGMGIDAHVAARFNAPENHRRGFSGYLRISAGAFLTYAPAWYRISTAEDTTAVRAVLVVVANSAQYGNGARIAPDARIDDGELDLVVVEEHSRLATLAQLPRLFNGSIARAAGYSIRRVREVSVECREPIGFHVDGEPAEGGTTLTARIHPAALKVCVGSRPA